MGSVRVNVLLFLFYAFDAIACPDSCTCDGVVMRCSRSMIPRDFPALIDEVYIEDLDFDSLSATVFTNSKWENVTFLDLRALNGTLLKNETFVGLDNLEHLGIHCFELRSMETSVFQGLENVRSLDLSDNGRLTFAKLLPTLVSKVKQIHVLPSLERLNLTRMSFIYALPLQLDKWFSQAVSHGRSLAYLDISQTNIILDAGGFFHDICDTLEHLVFKDGFLAQVKNYVETPACQTLHTVDMTDTKLPVFSQWIDAFSCKSLSMFRKVKNLLASGIVTSIIELSSFHLDMSDCDFQMEKIVLRKNQLKWLNVTVTLNKTLSESVKEIDLSDNIIEFLSPEFVSASVNLEILRLSYNILVEMQRRFVDVFERLLLRLSNLKQIYLDGNNLIDIPRRLFENNKKLEHVDLSRNRLMSITFGFMHLKHLKHLDVSKNLISALDDFVSHFDNLNKYHWLTAQNRSHNSTSQDLEDTTWDYFQVKFGSNPFKCSCTKDLTQSFEWIKLSPTVYRINESYYCNFQDTSIDILNSLSNKIEMVCAHQKLINTLKVALPVAATFFVVLFICVIRFRRQRRRKQKYHLFLSDLHNDIIKEKFLLFLSFCSEDTDFVLKNVDEPLQNSLRELTGNNRNFVCIGDREFRLGLPVHAEVMRCMDDSSIVIFVVSKTFCKKDWCKMEVGEAYDQGKPIIMIMKERVEIEDMPNVLARIFNRYTHAAWVEDENGGHLEPRIKAISKSVILLAMQSTQNKAQED